MLYKKKIQRIPTHHKHLEGHPLCSSFMLGHCSKGIATSGLPRCAKGLHLPKKKFPNYHKAWKVWRSQRHRNSKSKSPIRRFKHHVAEQSDDLNHSVSEEEADVISEKEWKQICEVSVRVMMMGWVV